MLQIVTLLTVALTAAVWSTRRRVEMSEFEEWQLRYGVQYKLATKCWMTWQMAGDIAAKVPRAWL